VADIAAAVPHRAGRRAPELSEGRDKLAVTLTRQLVKRRIWHSTNRAGAVVVASESSVHLGALYLPLWSNHEVSSAIFQFIQALDFFAEVLSAITSVMSGNH
jgi:hypothetical protein